MPVPTSVNLLENDEHRALHDAAYDLTPTGGTDGQFAQLSSGVWVPHTLVHSDLGGVTADQHHAEVHDADGADHNFPGGTVDFLRADGTWADPGGGGGGGGSVGVDRRLNSANAPGGADDDEFTGTSLTGWTRVSDGSSPYSWAEGYDRALAYKTSAGTDKHLDAQVKARTMSVGDYIETAVLPSYKIWDGLGLIMANGASYGAGTQAVAWVFRGATDSAELNVRIDAWTNYNTSGSNAGGITFADNMGGEIYIRLKYEAANTFGVYLSLDGKNWLTGTSSFSLTMTPTHVGIVALNWTPATSPVWFGWHYFRVNPA